MHSYAKRAHKYIVFTFHSAHGAQTARKPEHVVVIPDYFLEKPNNANFINTLALPANMSTRVFGTKLDYSHKNQFVQFFL